MIEIKIGIIGSGYVGTNVGEGLIKLGNEVIFYDNHDKKIQELMESNYNVVKSISELLKKTRVLFLCLPTPTVNNKIDLSHIISVSEQIGKQLKNSKGFFIIVIKSTVTPTTTEKLIIPTLEKYSGKKIGKDFGVCVNPEFLTEIHQTWTENDSFSRDFFTEERVIIGESDKSSGDILEELYRPLNVPIFRTDTKTAEMIKYTSNVALSSRISFWNEIFLICKHLDIDSNQVSEIVSMDKRIGKYGTIHGMAFGGKCLPKDLKALVSFVEENLGFKPEVLEAVNSVNEYMKEKYGVRE